MSDYEFNRINKLRDEGNKDECVNCGSKAHETHHVFFGPNRKHSEKFRLTIRLCYSCHKLIHKNSNLALYYKEIFQRIFELKYSREEFTDIFGRNYL